MLKIKLPASGETMTKQCSRQKHTNPLGNFLTKKFGMLFRVLHCRSQERYKKFQPIQNEKVGI
jgi:hypothetical protein